MRVAACGDEQERTPARGVQLVVIDLERLPRDVRQHRQRIAELAPVEAGEQVVQRIGHAYDDDVDEVLAKAEEWRATGEDVALATVVATRRSAPRPLGAKLAVTGSGRLFGSVSGGCVEADVAERAKAVLAGEPPAVVAYGIEDEEAWSVGLPCGGEIDVFVERFSGAPPIDRGTSYVVVAGEGAGERWHDASRSPTGLREEGARTVFAEAVAPPPRLVAVGAGDIAEALCALAKPLGWHTVVVDPRAGLATRERVPSADELVVAWPDEIDVDSETALVSLVHEERLDLPALRAGVEGGAFYVGALGSRRAQEKRRAKLGAIGDRVRGPVGLDLGGQTPAEMALEIVAEILAALRQTSVTEGAVAAAS
jgi:xanthine dehydrogenase accessory factor